MTLLSTARGAWRALTPEPVRRLAQPILGPALEAYVRHQARAPHDAETSAGPIRAALAGRTVTPSVFDMMLVLGRAETLARLEDVAV